jgi:hypothetical protein
MKTPDWMKSPDWTKPPDWMNSDAFKPKPVLDTVRFESEPPGAEARSSSGQSCRTPCALALPLNAPLTVNFTLNGYQPATEKLQPVAVIGNPTQLQPNPVVVELTPAPPAKPAAKKPPTKKPAAARPTAAAPRSQPTTAMAPAPAPMSASPPPQQAPAPWPSTPPPQR